jgi:hypothetical protein
MRRGVEEGDASGVRRLDGGDRRGIVEPRIEIAERRAAEAERAHLQAGFADRSLRQRHGAPRHRSSGE